MPVVPYWEVILLTVLIWKKHQPQLGELISPHTKTVRNVRKPFRNNIDTYDTILEVERTSDIHGFL